MNFRSETAYRIIKLRKYLRWGSYQESLKCAIDCLRKIGKQLPKEPK